MSPREELVQMYETGAGSFKARATYEIDEGRDRDRGAAVPSIRQQKCSNKSRIKCGRRNCRWSKTLRDESDHEKPTRLVIVPKSNRVDTQALMAHLFATTDLERNYRVNLNVIGLDGRLGSWGSRNCCWSGCNSASRR